MLDDGKGNLYAKIYGEITNIHVWTKANIDRYHIQISRKAGDMNRCHTCKAWATSHSHPVYSHFQISSNIMYVCIHYPTISCHNQAIILKGVLIWDNLIVPTKLWIKPSRVHYFKDWTGCFDINIKHRDWLRVCIKAVLGHSWDLPIIQPRLRMTENHCNPTATWLGLENGLNGSLHFVQSQQKWLHNNKTKLFPLALMCHHVCLDPGRTCNSL